MAALSQGPRANLGSLVSYIYRTFARTFTRKPLAFMASAAPYMALGALIFAGAEGNAKKLGLPKTGGEARPACRSSASRASSRFLRRRRRSRKKRHADTAKPPRFCG